MGSENQTGSAGEFAAHTERTGPGSDRTFGLVFAAVFALIGALPRIHHHPLKLWSLGLAALILVMALLQPRWLHLPNKLWHRFGLLLGLIVTPIMMGLIFFVAITPIALLRRSLKSSGMPLHFDLQAGSYWIQRESDVGSFNQQF